MRIALVGAAGFTGTLIAQKLGDLGLGITPVEGLSGADLDAVIGDHDVVVSAMGPFVDHGPGVIEACLRHDVTYIGVAGEEPFFRYVYDLSRVSPMSAPLVISAGFHFLVGDALATLAARKLPGAPTEIHTAYYLDRPLRTLLGAPSGTRRSVMGLVGRPLVVRRHGQWEEERLAETRRLAWFPKPVGPCHAAAVPGLEALSLPRRFPSVETARTYLAMSSWQAELLQAAGAMTRDPGRREWLAARVAASDRVPDKKSLEANRWACVAEASDADGVVVRAWGNGTDTFGFTAAAVAALVRRVEQGMPLPPGVVAPGDLDDVAGLLDELADAGDLRWSIVTP